MRTAIVVIAILMTILNPQNASSQRRYILPCRADLIEVSREYARQQMGKTERNNRAPHVDQYCRVVGIPLGSPYCAAGQYWCYWEACKRLSIGLENIPLPRSGLAYDVYRHARRYGKETGFEPHVDDAVVWKNPGKITGHTARIFRVLENGWVDTYEFNTVILRGTQREGDGNSVKRRNLKMPLSRMQIVGLVGYERI